MKIQCRWTGHVVRMEDDRIPKIFLYGQQEIGVRYRGRPLLRYKDRLRHTLKAVGGNFCTTQQINLKMQG